MSYSKSTETRQRLQVDKSNIVQSEKNQNAEELHAWKIFFLTYD